LAAHMHAHFLKRRYRLNLPGHDALAMTSLFGPPNANVAVWFSTTP
jgi:hypothetical protein